MDGSVQQILTLVLLAVALLAFFIFMYVLNKKSEKGGK
jgi:hypothetical protein